jgi:hypothetical protein
MEIKSYRDLRVWQAGMDLVVLIPSPRLLALSSAFLLTLLLGVWAATDRPAAWARLGLIAVGLGGMLLLAWAGGRWGEAILGPAALACAGLAAALGGYYLLGADWHADAGAKLPAVQQIGIWVQAHRPAVTLPEDIHPNVAGGLLAILLPLGAAGCAWAWLRGRRGLALAAALALLLGLGAAVLTVSRGAWLGLAAAAVLALGLSLAPRAGRSTAGRVLLTAGAVAILALPVLSALVDLPLADRLAGSVGVGGAAISRTALWRDALALIGDYPFTGSGLGSTAMVYSTYALLIHAPYLYHVHSLLLQLAVEQGVLGAALFAALLGGALWAVLARRAGRSETQGPARPWAAALAVAVVASLAALVVHGALVAGVYASKGVPGLFLPLGMAYALATATAPAATCGGRRCGVDNGRTPTLAGQVTKDGGRTAGVGIALAATAALLLLPASQAAFQANLGALSQTRAELAAFHWPQTPLQDVLRRPGGVDLAPAEGRFGAALALAPDNVTANRRLGQIALANEDFAAARGYLEAAYRAAPGQRATRQMLGEIVALAGDPAAAAARWRGIDFGGGQVQEVREWWYEHLGQPQRAEAIRQAERLVGR